MSTKLIKVKVFPRSKTSEIIARSNDAFDVYVRAKPERNEANFETLALIAKHFNVPLSSVRLLRGRAQKNKLFEIRERD